MTATFRYEHSGIYLTGDNLDLAVAWHVRHHRIEPKTPKRFYILDPDIIEELKANLKYLGIKIREIFEETVNNLEYIFVGNVRLPVGMDRWVNRALDRCFVQPQY